MACVLFRVDASGEIGLGHAVRCLALAGRLRTLGLSSLFACAEGGDALAAEIRAQRHVQVVIGPSARAMTDDAAATVATARRHGDVVAVVLDHYGLDLRWDTALRRAGLPLVVIDDLARRHDCDLLVDPNPQPAGRDAGERAPPSTRQLVGPRFALLRPEFPQLRDTAPVRRRVDRLLVFFGGGDDATHESAKALHGVLGAPRDWLVDVVAGAGTKGLDALQALADGAQGRVRLHVQTARMAELMARADLAVGAAGSASWERCCLRLPAVVGVLADNQRDNAGHLHAAGAAIDLGATAVLTSAHYAAAALSIDDARLAAMSAAAGGLVDGHGAMRVAEAVVQLIGSGH